MGFCTNWSLYEMVFVWNDSSACVCKNSGTTSYKKILVRSDSYAFVRNGLPCTKWSLFEMVFVRNDLTPHEIWNYWDHILLCVYYTCVSISPKAAGLFKNISCKNIFRHVYVPWLSYNWFFRKSLVIERDTENQNCKYMSRVVQIIIKFKFNVWVKVLN